MVELEFVSQSVAMIDCRKAAPSPCNCRVRPRDYPQGKPSESRATRGFAQRKRAWRLSRPLILGRGLSNNPLDPSYCKAF